jgi:uncharacterized protein (TIGR02266 family)
MTQDTRKDRRVKIVSLNVRYKSATVDEFIENHAHDVSRGGIYIKTGNPFPQGTLLKFEIRLASDQTVITGVGRVVWKREAAQGEQPAGMGVKFIKVDDSSKVVIDRLVTTRSDAGKAFESELDPTALPRAGSGSESMAPQSSAPGAKRKMTPHKPASSAGPPPLSRSAAPASRPSSAPRPVAPSPLFPKASSLAPDAPKQEQTVMKQAAELLEEALREAGGSMEEVGTNPLFSSIADPASASKGAVASSVSSPPERRSLGSLEPLDEGAAARGMVAALSPGHASKSEAGDSPRRAAVSSAIAAPPCKRGSTLGLILGVIAVVAIAVVVFNRDKLFGAAPEPTPSAAAPPPSASAPLAVEAPPSSASPTAASPAIDAATEPSAASASASASASAAPSSKPTSAAVTAPSPPVQAAKPAAAAAPASASAPTPSTPMQQAPAASAPATADSSQAAGASPVASATSRAPKPAASAVKAPTKPTKPAENDNPY